MKAAIKFGRQTITLDEVISTLRSWEMEIISTSKKGSNGESLNIRGRQKERYQSRGRSKTRSKSRYRGDKWWKKLKCFECQEIGHTKRFCPKNKRGKEQEESKGEAAVAQDGYDSSEVLVVSTIDIDKN